MVRFDWSKSLWLWGLLIPAVAFGVPALTWRLSAISAVLTLLTLCLGHSVGLHRGIIHRTYEAHRFVRGVLAELFVLTGLGGPLSWARLHAVRDYWQNQPAAPRALCYTHSLARDFWWNLHCRFVSDETVPLRRLPSDVMNDRFLRFLEATWPLHTLAFALVVFAVGGADAVAVCIALRVVLGILGHWAIGYASHVWGEERYVIEGASTSGRNSWVLGVISFGEGFHNTHHAFPHSARMGLRWYEFDLGWYALNVFRALGLIHGLRSAEGAPREASHSRGAQA
jgi:stearoyl-CoA desaturase (delta-9 desaturase)